MIKFFRHIRKALIEKNQMGKYFKYAIGEILLVMIGILLALQVSNWNDIQKERKLENRYLTELVLDLQTDSLAISNFVSQSNLQLQYKLKVLDFIEEKTVYSQDSLSVFFNYQWQMTYSFNPITTTLDEMKSTGNIGVIKNSHLRRNILKTYNNYLVYINQHESIYNEQQSETWKLLFSSVPNLYTGIGDGRSFMDVRKAMASFEVQNRIYGNYVSGLNTALKELETWNTDLLIAIRAESKRLKND